MGLITPMVIMIARSLLGREAGFDRLFVGVEIANVASAKSHLVFSPCKQSNAGDRTRTALVALGVPHVSGAIRASQVLKAVVKRVPINVINVRGPFAGYHKPDYAVGKLGRPTENSAIKVPMPTNMVQSAGAGKPTVPHVRLRNCIVPAAVLEPMHATLAPRQNAAGSVIFKKLFKNFAGKVGFSHWGLSERSLWSGLVEWWNTPQARIYTPSCRANAMREV